MLTLWGVVLAAITLNLARIPLTVFAFLGGALAIGVGFGTQTIIRNLISGMIVLMERRVQIGDLIELDGRAAPGASALPSPNASSFTGFSSVSRSLPLPRPARGPERG